MGIFSLNPRDFKHHNQKKKLLNVNFDIIFINLAYDDFISILSEIFIDANCRTHTINLQKTTKQNEK